MKKDTEIWLSYADDNLKSTKVLLDSELYNPCLQNAQQAVLTMLSVSSVLILPRRYAMM
jgi:HEPN domain-containing protein